MEQGLNFEWTLSSGARADSLDEEILTKMKKAGCRRIWLSPESGNQYVVNSIIKKRLDLKQVENAIRICKRLGIEVSVCFVIGFIGETKRNIEESIQYAQHLKELGVGSISPFIATPLPGTELYNQAIRLGYLKGGPNEIIDFSHPLIETPDFTLEELSQLYRKFSRVTPLVQRGSASLLFKILFTRPTVFARMAAQVVSSRVG